MLKIYPAHNSDVCLTQSRIRGSKHCIPNSQWQLFSQQKRWSANNRPDGQTQPPPTTYALHCASFQIKGRANFSTSPQPDTTKSRILSRVPLKTREDIYNIPNMLTFSRLIAAPFVGYFLVHNHHAAALALFAYAGITDLVDGYLARRWQLQTVVGTIIDPMADKLLMTIGVACLAVNGSIPGRSYIYSPTCQKRFPMYNSSNTVWLAVIILGRDVGLALSAIYYRWISLPPPKTMARYWDFSLPSAEVKPTEISKINTALQLFLVGSAIGMPVLPETILSAWHLKEAMTGFQ